MQSFEISPIGYAESPYGEKFAVPRQPGLAPHARCVLRFVRPFDDPAAFRGLEGFSHVIVLFVFDRAEFSGFKPTVRPPRLGGNTRMGVFATRSPFRPSRIGMSVVRLERILCENGAAALEISGADLVDGTPIVDIKPYIPFADSIPDARGGFAEIPPELHEVIFTDRAREDLSCLSEEQRLGIEEALAQDPRPAYKGDDEPGRVYGVRLYGLDVHFRVADGVVTVTDAATVDPVNS